MQLYRENAKWRERTYDFVAWVGIERIRAVIEDSEGLDAALDAAMQASVDAAYDPWKEASAPKTEPVHLDHLGGGGVRWRTKL